MCLRFKTFLKSSAQARLDEVRAFDVVVYSGGGNLIPMYSEGLHVIQQCAAWGKQVVVLPHSTTGYGAELASVGDNLRILCREQVSYDGLIADGFPPSRLGLDCDMAFHIPPGFFTRGDVRPAHGLLLPDGPRERPDQPSTSRQPRHIAQLERRRLAFRAIYRERLPQPRRVPASV